MTERIPVLPDEPLCLKGGHAGPNVAYRASQCPTCKLEDAKRRSEQAEREYEALNEAIRKSAAAARVKIAEGLPRRFVRVAPPESRPFPLGPFAVYLLLGGMIVGAGLGAWLASVVR